MALQMLRTVKSSRSLSGLLSIFGLTLPLERLCRNVILRQSRRISPFVTYGLVEILRFAQNDAAGSLGRYDTVYDGRGKSLPRTRSGAEGERRFLLVAALISVFLLAPGFTYQLALPGRTLTFPADHYSHPDFKTEWWYYTGHLQSESGKRYGYQVTFFRFGLRDRQKNSQKQPPLFTELYMAHFALSDIAAKKFVFRERINRGYHNKAGAATDRYLVWNEEWKVEGDGKKHSIEVNDRETKLRLSLVSLKAPVLHGQNGLSQKGEGEGRASYYYSLTRMETEGEIAVAGKREKVRGLSWMDHEFGSNQLREDQVGWDWFSIRLDNQTELMLYLIRRKDGSPDPYSSGTLIRADGTTRHLTLQDFRIEVLDRWKSPKSGGDYPMKWKVTIPTEAVELEIRPEFPDQELITSRSTRVTYWEGAAQISGTVRQKPVNGTGYVEMTGYAGKINV
jgi:predicted secreted hydrolase